MPVVDQTQHLFGRSLNYRAMILAGDEDVFLSASSLVSARLYAAQPTDAQAQDSSAALGGFLGTAKTSWTSEGGNEFLVAFDALTDPEPLSENEHETYYVVVSFKSETAGPTGFVSEAVTVWRADSVSSRIRVTPANVVEFEQKLGQLKGEDWIQPKISAAIRHVMRVLRAKGFSRKRMANLEVLEDAVRIWALYMCCRDMSGQDNQFWLEKAKLYADEFALLMELIKVNYDSDGDGIKEPAETTDRFSSIRLAR